MSAVRQPSPQTGLIYPWLGFSFWGALHAIVWNTLAALAIVSHLRGTLNYHNMHKTGSDRAYSYGRLRHLHNRTNRELLETRPCSNVFEPRRRASA